MRIIMIMLAGALVVGADDYAALVKQVEKDYAVKQKEYNAMVKAERYRWEFVAIGDMPWCDDEILNRLKGDTVWIDGYGPVAVADKEGVVLAVRSWVEKSADQSQVTRVYLYKKVGRSWARSSVIKTVQNWNDEIGWICQR